MTRRGRPAFAALLAIGGVACGGGETTVPLVPGSITVTTQTSGFMKDDSYQLLVDGASVGTIGANDVMTVPELEPATYQLDLGDLAGNCVAAPASITVNPNQTSDASLSVTCAITSPTSYTIRANRDRPDLDDGSIVECTFGICPSNANWDIYANFSTQTSPQASIRHNTTNGVQIAHVVGRTLATLTEADVAGAAFTTALVTDPFDAGRVILIRTNLGALHALGNPVENTTLLTLSFDAALLSAGP
jgi:hypothetical protein